MRELEDAFLSDNWGRVAVRIREGRGTGVLFLAVWMLREVSPRLSGNYHVFSGVGNYPLRHFPPRSETRKGLRRLMNRAIVAGVLEEVIPEYKNEVDTHADNPPNAAPDPNKRLDIPLIGWDTGSKSEKHVVLIPTSWRNKQYHSQIHATPTYRLKTNDSQVAIITELGELILNKHESFENYLRSDIESCWRNLNRFLQKQHYVTRGHYKFELERLEKTMRGNLQTRRTACALYLASTLIRLWPPSWVISCTKTITALKRMPPPADS